MSYLIQFITDLILTYQAELLYEYRLVNSRKISAPDQSPSVGDPDWLIYSMRGQSISNYSRSCFTYCLISSLVTLFSKRPHFRRVAISGKVGGPKACKGLHGILKARRNIRTFCSGVKAVDSGAKYLSNLVEYANKRSSNSSIYNDNCDGFFPSNGLTCARSYQY